MKTFENLKLSRRTFVASISGILAGYPLFGAPSLLSPSIQETQNLPEELTSKEKEWVEKSSMAKDLENFFGKGHSCAESLLMVSLKHLDKPEELVWAAAGFGGGMTQKDLCGFLTAGIMGIGFAAGELKIERKEAKKHSSKLVKEYWKWWKSVAPLKCSDIRTPETSSKVCARLGKLAATKIEELINRKYIEEK
jgi:hypothetical protein